MRVGRGKRGKKRIFGVYNKLLELMWSSIKGWAEKYYVLLRAPWKPNPPAPLPYEGMGVISLSPSRREVPSIVIDFSNILL